MGEITAVYVLVSVSAHPLGGSNVKNCPLLHTAALMRREKNAFASNVPSSLLHFPPLCVTH